MMHGHKQRMLIFLQARQPTPDQRAALQIKRGPGLLLRQTPQRLADIGNAAQVMLLQMEAALRRRNPLRGLAST